MLRFPLPRLRRRGRSTAGSQPAIDFLASRDAITRFLFIEDPPEPVDFAFVLGSLTTSSVEPAVELYRRGLTSRIVISGFGPSAEGQPDRRSEAEIHRDHAIAQGVRDDDILIETRATNTLENFRFTSPIVERHLGWDKIRAVSISGKPFHMRRALMTARAEWPPHLRLVMLPSKRPDDPPAQTWWQTEAGRRFVLNELRSIGAYGLQGDLGGF